MSTEPRLVEPSPVQLTRIEGSVNLIAERVGNVQGQISDLKTDLTALSQRVTAVELVQAQTVGASTSWRSWVPVILTAVLTAVAVITFFLSTR